MSGVKKSAPMVPLDRVKAIIMKEAPAEYVSGESSWTRAVRSPVYKQGMVILPHGENLPVVIRNLSATGCRVEYFQNRTLEGRVLITEPSLPLRRWGQIVWQGEGASGVAFEKE